MLIDNPSAICAALTDEQLVLLDDIISCFDGIKIVEHVEHPLTLDGATSLRVRDRDAGGAIACWFGDRWVVEVLCEYDTASPGRVFSHAGWGVPGAARWITWHYLTESRRMRAGDQPG